MCICALCACLVPTKDRSVCQTSWKQSDSRKPPRRQWMQTVLCSARVANTLNHWAMTPAPIPHISYNELKPLQRVQVFFKIISDVCAVSMFHKGKLSSERNNALCMSVLLMEEHKEISLLNPHSRS